MPHELLSLMSEINGMEDNQVNPLLGKDSYSAIVIEAPLL
jgi:hypothetical protein